VLAEVWDNHNPNPTHRAVQHVCWQECRVSLHNQDLARTCVGTRKAMPVSLPFSSGMTCRQQQATADEVLLLDTS